jgi:hypothetical protein
MLSQSVARRSPDDTDMLLLNQGLLTSSAFRTASMVAQPSRAAIATIRTENLIRPGVGEGEPLSIV